MRTEIQILDIGSGPLWRLRCTQQEYNNLLMWLSKNSAKNTSYSRIFVLAAAETLRRRYQGGPWQWEIIEKAIPQQPNERDKLVEQGLKGWKCEVRRGRDGAMLRLSSLICEGGIPPHLIAKEQGMIRRWGDRVLVDLREGGFTGEEPDEVLAEIAARQARAEQVYLKDRGIHLLFGQLLGALWSLRRQQGEFPAGDIPAWLDQCAPGWRARLPLDLEDKEAERLLRDLLSTADRVERGERRPVLQTWMQEKGRLHRKLRMPSVWTEGLLRELFGEEPFRRRMELILVSAQDRYRVGQLIQEGADWRCIEEARTLPGDGELRIELRGGFGMARVSALPGGRALPPLPRVFAQDREDKRWRLVGTGSVRHPASPLRVMFPPGASAPTGVGLVVAQCEGCEVIEIRAPLKWERDGDTFHIVPGVAMEEVGELVLEGARYPWSRPGEEIFLGLPAVYLVTDQGTRRKLKPEELRLRQGASPWQVWSSGQEGLVRARWVSGARICGECSFRVVPPGFTIEQQKLSPKSFLLGYAGGWLGVPSPLGFTVCQDKGQLRVDVQDAMQPPARIDLRVSFPSNQQVVLRYPFPLERDAFFHDDGRLASGAVEVAELIRLTAEARGSNGRPKLSLRLNATDEWLYPFPVGSDGIYTVRLSEIQPAVELMLRQSADLDAGVQVRILWLGAVIHQPVTLTVQRYCRSLKPEKEMAKVLLEPPPVKSAGADPEGEDDGVGEVTVSAFRFLAPGQVRQLPRIKPGWQWAFAGMEPGAWLLVSQRNGVELSRPVAWWLPGEDGVQGALAAALRQASTTRMSEIKKVFKQMAAGKGAEEDWDLLEESVKSLVWTDISALDTMRALAEEPRLAARLLLRLNSGEQLRLWQGMEGLPFLWALVGREDWMQALEQLYQHRAAWVPAEAMSLVDPSANKVAAMSLAFDMIYQEWRVSKKQPPTRMSCAEAAKTQPMIRQSYVQQIQQMANELLLRHQDHDWPVVSSAGEATLHKLFPGIHLPEHDTNKSLHQQPVLMAPVVAAACAARGERLSTKQIRLIQRLRAFDVDWFDGVHPILLALFLAASNYKPKTVFQ